MKNHIHVFMLSGCIALLGACENEKNEEELLVVKDNISFTADIQPILTAECAGCHNPANVNPDLRENHAYESLMEGDEEGIVPGNSEESELIEMLERQSEDGNNMPPSTPLSPLQIAFIKKWIDEGALDN